MKTRMHLRVPLPIPVRYRTTDMAEAELTRIRDISWGGVFVYLKRPLAQGTRVIVEFLMSDDSVAIEIWGTVVRVENSPEGKVLGMGVKFDEIDDETRSAIQKMVATYIQLLLKRVSAQK